MEPFTVHDAWNIITLHTIYHQIEDMANQQTIEDIESTLSVQEVEGSDQDAKKKRGRKPKQNKKNYYFCTEQEKAVVDYISTDDVKKKNQIFNSILRPAFTKMIEAIIRRYNLYPPAEEFQETFDDTI